MGRVLNGSVLAALMMDLGDCVNSRGVVGADDQEARLLLKSVG
jgi:hypothetical protein